MGPEMPPDVTRFAVPRVNSYDREEGTAASPLAMKLLSNVPASSACAQFSHVHCRYGGNGLSVNDVMSMAGHIFLTFELTKARCENIQMRSN